VNELSALESEELRRRRWDKYAALGSWRGEGAESGAD
jgi:hypothetical protein